MDVFLEKTTDMEELEETPSMEVGNELEGAIINWSLKILGKPEARRNVRRVHANGIMAANLDCQIVDGDGSPIPLEVKFSAQPQEWGDEGKGFDGIPLQYGFQVLHQMACVGAKRAYLGVFLAGFRGEFRLYDIRGVDEHLGNLVTREELWWRTHVETLTAPEDCEPASLETLARIRRVEGESVVVPDELVEAWRSSNEARKTAEKVEEEAKSRLLAALGTAEIGDSNVGRITYFQQSSRIIDSTRIKAERPDIAEAYTKVNSFRVCRFVAPKAAKGGKGKVGA